MTRRANKKNRNPLNRRKQNSRRLALETLEARTVLDAAMSAAMVSFMGEDLVGKDGPMAKLGWDLALLHHDYAVVEPDAPDENEPTDGDDSTGFVRNEYQRDQMYIENDHVHMQFVAASQDLGAEMISSLGDLGMQIVASNEIIASGWVPINALNEVADLSSIGTVTASRKAITNSGLADTEGDEALGTDNVRATLGYLGSGVKVGVISDSYDVSAAASDTAADNVLSGDLPGLTNPNGYTTPVQVLGDGASADLDEGRAILQIIHDIAPAAELVFSSPGIGKFEFANTIRALDLIGSDIIVDDMTRTNEPMFMDGLISQAINDVVGNGTSYFTSAGNFANQGFRQAWDGTGQPYNIINSAGTVINLGGEAFDFNPLSPIDESQGFDLLPSGILELSVQWDDPFYTDSLGQNGASTDLDVYLIDSTGLIVASGINRNIGGDPYELISYQNTSAQTQHYGLVILRYDGDAPNVVTYVNFGDEMNNLEYATNSPTIFGHHNTSQGNSVGAAAWFETPAFGTNPAELEFFSSVGGTSILFTEDGDRQPEEIRQAPAFVAPDGGNTTFFGTDIDLDTYPNFFGTSASAPHAAAVAALMLSANPALSPSDVTAILKGTALDMDNPYTPGFDNGFDFASGYGFIDAYTAVQAAASGFIPTPTPTPGGGGGGGTTDPEPDLGCGEDFTLPTNIEVQEVVGSNIFVSGHSILDNGTSNGQLGYDAVVLDFLRGDGTLVEIEKSNYSVAILGNDGLDWSFTDGTQGLTGYAATDFYDIDLLTAVGWADVFAHDAMIIMSHDSVVIGGITDEQLAVLAGVNGLMADAVNDYGLDIWVNSPGTATGMYDFLPTGILTTATLAASTDFYSPTTEGELFGLTSVMANSNTADIEYSTYDSDFFLFETRGTSEIVALAAQSVGFVNDQLVDAETSNQSPLPQLQGVSFNDLNQNGRQDANEAGLAGFTFYIDENGDGQIGLCEPSAVSDADGKFLLYTHQAGDFIIQPVLEQGYLPTDDLIRTVTVSNSGSAEVNAPLDFGYIRANDTGNAGNPVAIHPVLAGLKLGDSPLLDDGVIFTQGLTVGATNVATITSSTPLSDGILQGWMDFNRDGDWDDAGEQIFTNLALTSGTNDYTFEIPATAFDDSSFPDGLRVTAATRFRLDFTRDLTPTSVAFAGEVEDYEVALNSDADSGIRLADDSYYYAEDTAGQFFHVLNNDNHLLGKNLSIISVTNISPADPLLVFSVSADGKSVLLDTTDLVDLGENITFTYNVVDSSGNTGSADVTLQVGLVGGLATTGSTSGSLTSAFTNTLGAADVNNDGIVSFLDVAKIVTELQKGSFRALPKYVPNQESITNFIDTDGNNQISPLDLLKVIDFILSGKITAEPEAEFIETTLVSASPVSASVELVQPTVAAEETPAVSDATQFVGWALNWRSNSAAASRVETESSLSTMTSDLATDSFFEGLDSDLSQVIADASDDDQWYLASDLEETVDGLAVDLNEKWDEELEEAL